MNYFISKYQSLLGNHTYSPYNHAFFVILIGRASIADTNQSEIYLWDGGLVLPQMIPSCIIQLSHRSLIRFLSSLFTSVSTSWQRPVHPSRICSTSTPRFCILPTTDAIIWHLCESRNKIGIIWSGAYSTHGLKIVWTHIIITRSSIQALCWQV